MAILNTPQIQFTIHQNVAILGARLARRSILKQLGEAAEPLLRVEEDLVEMATSTLQDSLIAAVGVDRYMGVRDQVAATVRSVAGAKILAYETDSTISSKLMTEIEMVSLDELLPP